MRDLLRDLIAIAGVPVEVREDPAAHASARRAALRRKRGETSRPHGVAAGGAAGAFVARHLCGGARRYGESPPDGVKRRVCPPTNLHAFVFKNRGAVLALPALALAAFGKPSALSVTLGLPMAIAGELVRCWAVGYSGVTTRGERVSAPKLVTAGPYAHVRNPLYAGTFITACGFAIAFTGKNALPARLALIAGSLGGDGRRLRDDRSARRTLSAMRSSAKRSSVIANACRPSIPQLEPMPDGAGTGGPRSSREAESKTFLTFGAMLAALALKALKA